TKALRFGHAEIEPEHLLLALLDQPEGLAGRLLLRADVDTAALRAAVEAHLERLPRVTGPGSDGNAVRISRGVVQVLDAAEKHAERMKDDYVSVEHVLLAMAEAPRTGAGRLLADVGVTSDRL